MTAVLTPRGVVFAVPVDLLTSGGVEDETVRGLRVGPHPAGDVIALAQLSDASAIMV